MVFGTEFQVFPLPCYAGLNQVCSLRLAFPLKTPNAMKAKEAGSRLLSLRPVQFLLGFPELEAWLSSTLADCDS